MKNFKIKPEDKKRLLDSINRIAGVIQSIKSDVEGDHACDETVTRVQAAKGALSTLGKEMITFGVLNCLSRYSKEELQSAVKIMFKID
jgi:DNA-binding FrmR family transcriptional regulator